MIPSAQTTLTLACVGPGDEAPGNPASSQTRSLQRILPLSGPWRTNNKHFECLRVTSSLTSKQIDEQEQGSSDLLNCGHALKAWHRYRRFWNPPHIWRFRRL